MGSSGLGARHKSLHSTIVRPCFYIKRLHITFLYFESGYYGISLYHGIMMEPFDYWTLWSHIETLWSLHDTMKLPHLYLELCDLSFSL